MAERMCPEVDILAIRIPICGRKLAMAPQGVTPAAPKSRRDETW